MKPGDIILFYRSRDLHAITSVGVIDQFYPDTSPEEIIRIIGKRSVYSKDEIERSNKNHSVIIFRHHFHLKESIPRDTLKKTMIMKDHPQSMTEIDQNAYEWIKKKGGLDESFTVH
ncbi:MAG: EVE domain-containing protein [Acidobacteria bacterium]|jgi:hypothetical protein|nr:EVE domain-containing protein [Acidobacteriota bacterium]